MIRLKQKRGGGGNRQLKVPLQKIEKKSDG